jgi:RimJ/RimL family protein N-acetyltransferase
MLLALSFSMWNPMFPILLCGKKNVTFALQDLFFMDIDITKTTLDNIRAFRTLFLDERKFQFVHYKCHLHGWADTYLITIDGVKAGYGSVWGANKREDRDTIFEFYLVEPFRKNSSLIFSKLCQSSAVSFLECQTNDDLLANMFFEHAQNIKAEAILFEDHIETTLRIPGVAFGRSKDKDDHLYDKDGYFLEQNGKIVATGGFMLNYNKPYADIYMAVNEDSRGKGFGSLIVQELKKEIFKIERVPSARCNIINQISKATLIKAGLRPCGFLLNGEVRSEVRGLKSEV